MIALGFSFWRGSHDSSAALVRDGRLIAAAEEERFTRVKHDGSVPLNAIAYCLRAGGLTMPDVDIIVYPDRPFRWGPNSQLAEMQWGTLRAMIRSGHARHRSLLHKAVAGIGSSMGLVRDAGINPMVAEGFDLLHRTYGDLPKIRFYGHHLSHAAAAYLTSGFEEAAVVTLDGRGGPLSGATWKAKGGRLDRTGEQPYTNSLGWFYRDCTRYAGLGDFGEGKLMGLAPYGRAAAMRTQLAGILDTGGHEWFTYKELPSEARLGFPPRGAEDILSGPYSDFAAATQESLERAYEAAVGSAARGNVPKLCVGGGVAMNCTANGRLLRLAAAEDIWIFPASGDAGLSVGAALLAARDAGELIRERQESPYWGPGFSDDECEHVLAREPAIEFTRPNDLSRTVAAALAGGKIAGWFQGRMELGPRALGNRSILADPRTVAMRDKVNLVKGREKWRPLAPSILAERTSEYFEEVPPNAFMLFAVQTKQVTRDSAPAIVHVDGSARPQPVSRELNRPYYDLIAAFEAATGVPILLNTSFNAAGEPIVCSPADAMRTFLATGLDVLVLGPFVATKRNQVAV